MSAWKQNANGVFSLLRPVERGEDEDEEPGGKWYNVEFHVKWKRWSFRHCSWDTLTTLSQLGGHKRVLNYCKRQDEMEVSIPAAQ